MPLLHPSIHTVSKAVIVFSTCTTKIVSNQGIEKTQWPAENGGAVLKNSACSNYCMKSGVSASSYAHTALMRGVTLMEGTNVVTDFTNVNKLGSLLVSFADRFGQSSVSSENYV